MLSVWGKSRSQAHLPSQLQGNADLWDWVAPSGVQALKSILSSA